MFHSVGGHRVVYRSLNQNDIRSSNQHFNVTTWYELNSAFKKKKTKELRNNPNIHPQCLHAKTVEHKFNTISAISLVVNCLHK